MKDDGMAGVCDAHGEKRYAYRGLVGKPEGKNHFENLGIEGRMILK
jgi:hypothetical protein